VIATFFGLGLLLALTPCVFPMIPILSGIIAGQKKDLTKTSGFLLSLAYVLGMAITYAVAGVAAALSGTLISNALQNPWALGYRRADLSSASRFRCSASTNCSCPAPCRASFPSAPTR
jgi:thiol:disulfide interchange protein